MQDTIARYLSGVRPERARTALRTVIEGLGGRHATHMIRTATLAIKTAGSALAMTTAVSYGLVNGKPITIASSVDMPALTDMVISANKYNVICFFATVAAASGLSALMGTEASTIAEVTFPDFPADKVLVGFILVTNGSSAFTGANTALDAATTIYISPTGPFDPTVLV